MAKIDLETIKKYGSKNEHYFKTDQNVFHVTDNVFNKCRKLVELVEEIDGVKLVNVTSGCDIKNIMFLEFGNTDSIIQVYVNSIYITVVNYRYTGHPYFNTYLKVGSSHVDEVVNFIRNYFINNKVKEIKKTILTNKNNTIMKQVKTQEKTYIVAETTDDYILCDENGFLTSHFQPLRVFKEFEVKEGEPWYGVDVFDIHIDMEDLEDIENIEDLDNDELDELIDNMDVQKFMNIVKDTLGEEGVEMLYQDSDRRCFFTLVDENYKAPGHKGHNMSYAYNGGISFQAKIKYKFWIENGIIKHEPVWEFGNI